MLRKPKGNERTCIEHKHTHTHQHTKVYIYIYIYIYTILILNIYINPQNLFCPLRACHNVTSYDNQIICGYQFDSDGRYLNINVLQIRLVGKYNVKLDPHFVSIRLPKANTN